MIESIPFYEHQARTRISSLPWLADIQKQACDDFVALGFPNRHVEDWKYTSLDAFLTHRFGAHSSSAAFSSQIKAPPVESYHQIIDNGSVIAQSLPQGAIILPLQEALTHCASQLKPYLNQILQSEHAFHALNTAMMQSGLFIYVPEQVHIEMPIWINHWQNRPDQGIFLRHLIILEKGSSLCVVEDYQGDDSSCYFTNAITEVYLSPHAQLTHYKIQRESKKAFHVGHVAVKQTHSSEYNHHSVNLGGQWVRSDLNIHFTEAHAQCLMNGLYLPQDGQHIDHHTLVRHAASDCQSRQDYKGILQGHSRAVFNGRVMVDRDAQHTEAHQQNKNLLLSAKAEVDTKPQLEIFADDVICTHGATVGQLDEDALFYLATRGIDREEGSRYLMRAFLNENCRLIANPAIATWINEILNTQLG